MGPATRQDLQPRIRQEGLDEPWGDSAELSPLPPPPGTPTTLVSIQTQI